MANSAFDPLRKDPFTTVNETSITVTSKEEKPLSLRNGEAKNSENSSEHVLAQVIPNPAQKFTREKTNRSIVSSISSRSVESSPVNAPHFAPPPSPPHKRDYTASLMMAESVSNMNAELPSFKKVHHSGTVLARISMRSLVTKKWKRVFWIQYGEASILIFRSKADFEEWVMNPYLSDEKRKSFIKLEIDLNSGNNIQEFRGYRPTRVHAKYYNHSGLLHQFKVDKWLIQGPSIAGAFGSQNEDEVMELYTILTDMIKRNPACTEFMNLPHDGTESLSSRSYGGYSSGGSVSSRGWGIDDRSVGSMNSAGSRVKNRGVLTAIARAKF